MIYKQENLHGTHSYSRIAREERKEKESRKPLILKEVKQCGKIYLLKDFGNIKNETNGKEVLNIPLYLISALERFTV